MLLFVLISVLFLFYFLLLNIGKEMCYFCLSFYSVLIGLNSFLLNIGKDFFLFIFVLISVLF